MAKVGGLVPIFNMTHVQNIFEDYIEERVNREIAILQRIGEEFVNKARSINTYTDRTGNLRSSIGYVLLWDGDIQKQNFNPKADAKKQVSELMVKLKSDYPKGMVLIGFAGMEYAAAVESKNYDVISGSAPTKQAMEDAFKKFLSK